MFSKKKPEKTSERRYDALEMAARRAARIARRTSELDDERLAHSTQGFQIVKDVLRGSIDAAQLANHGAGGDLPEGWRTVEPPAHLADAFERAGASHLVSPDGTAYLTFANHKPSMFEKLQQKLGAKTASTQAAYDIGREFANDTHVTFAGTGRGGAMAKLAAESASTRLTDGEGVDSKLCVAINSSAVPPRTYAAFGLATKNHERTTCHIVNEKDAHDRLKGFQRMNPSAAQRRAGASEEEIADFKKSEVYKIDFRTNTKFSGGARSGEARHDVAEDMRLTVKGDLGVRDLFKDATHSMGKYASPIDMPEHMRRTLVRNYAQSQREHGAAHAGPEHASHGESSSLGR